MLPLLRNRQPPRQKLWLALAVVTGAVMFPWSANAYIGFDASNLMADVEMTNSTSLNTQQISDFLNQRAPNCTVPVCLKNYRDTATNFSSSQIISQAATANDISPKVLLALLETETRLVTDQAPSPATFDNAFGLAGPSTFTAQTNAAAKILGDVMKGLQTPIYPVSSPVPIPYNTINTSCASPNVTIQTLASAALYTYPGLPDQPNAAALNAIYGSGDSCSSYGIRNFYIHYDQWFNSNAIDVTAPTSPFGLSATQPNSTSVNLTFGPSTDNRSIVSYRVFRNGALLVSLSPGVTSHLDTGLSYGNSYTYYVAAVDGSGNSSPPSNTVAMNVTDPRSTVYRFYSPVVKRHLYSADANEVNSIRSTMLGVWSFEGSSFKVTSIAGCGAGQSVYRFYSPLLKAHMYTMDEYEKSTIISTFSATVWRYEGVAFCSDKTQVSPEQKPVYRFYSELLKTHLYTMDEYEKSQITANYPTNVWRYEGIAYYAYPN